jgi:hypothetical protein
VRNIGRNPFAAALACWFACSGEHAMFRWERPLLEVKNAAQNDGASIAGENH